MANTCPQLPFDSLLTLPASAALSLSPAAVYTHFTHAQQLYTCVYVCMCLCTFCYARSSRGSKQLLRLPRGCHFCLCCCCCCCAPSVKTAPKAKWGNFHLSYAAATTLLLRLWIWNSYTHTHTRALSPLCSSLPAFVCVCLRLVRARFLHKCNLFSKFRLAYLCTSTTQQQRHTQTYMHT